MWPQTGECGLVSRGLKAGLGFGVHTSTMGVPEGHGIQSDCSFHVLIFLNVLLSDTGPTLQKFMQLDFQNVEYLAFNIFTQKVSFCC